MSTEKAAHEQRLSNTLVLDPSAFFGEVLLTTWPTPMRSSYADDRQKTEGAKLATGRDQRSVLPMYRHAGIRSLRAALRGAHRVLLGLLA